MLRRRKIRNRNRDEADGRAARDLDTGKEAVENKHRREVWERSHHGYVNKREGTVNRVVEVPGDLVHESHENQNAQPVHELWG
jgi:hypothetical protein